MALNRDYFNSISLPLVYGRYYDADRVDTLLLDIRRQTEALENELTAIKENMKRNATRHQEEAILSVQKMYTAMKDRNAKSDEELNIMFQTFLASCTDDVPEDLSSKVSLIADAIRDIDS